jgi:hypothetical protein
MNQRRLFDDNDDDNGNGDDFPPCDWGVPPEERPRLSRQCEAILNVLRIGPQPNTRLAQIALKYTSRISDIRKAGYRIKCVRRDHVLGRTWYELEE